MALRNYIYYKHEDELKDRIAHGSTSGLPPKSPKNNGSMTTSQLSSEVVLKKKARKLTPTQIRKLENIHITNQDYITGKTESNLERPHDHATHELNSDKSRSHSTTSVDSLSSSDVKED